MFSHIGAWLRRYRKWALVAVCLAVFAVLAEDVVNKEPVLIDKLNGVAVVFRSHDLTPAIKFLTDFGIITLPHIIIIALLIIVRDKRVGILAAVNLLMADSFNIFLKGIFHRPRPTGALMHIGGFSFPSGHSMIAMMFYGFLIYLAYKLVKQKLWRRVVITSLTVIILFIGWSRIYLGVHYVSDVVAGFAVSVVYVVLATTVSDWVLRLGGDNPLSRKLLMNKRSSSKRQDTEKIIDK